MSLNVFFFSSFNSDHCKLTNHDSLIMTGTSPFQAYQSPSFHSSSYLPKLEAQFFKDFSCCDVTLPSLHELLKHYEECHASQQMAPLGIDSNDGHDNTRPPPTHQQQSNGNHHDLVGQVSRGAGVTSPISGMGGLGLSMRQQQLAASQQRHFQQHVQQQRRPYGQREGDEGDLNDTEAAGEMDMDGEDLTPPPSQHQSHTPRHSQPQPLRLSAPGTPSHVLSSVNTPIMPHASLELPRHPISLVHNTFSPDSSVPGTPSAMEHPEFAFPHHLQGYPPSLQQQQPQQQPQQPQQQQGLGSENMFGDLCIDEPAKRLYTPGGYGITAAQMQHLKYSMGGMQGNQNNNPPGRVGGVQGLPMGGVEDKPFKCPVIGCEKAYKNQNGLKYHKSVSSI